MSATAALGNGATLLGRSHDNDKVTAVLRQCTVAGQQMQGLAGSLSEQQAVKRIRVGRRDVVGPARMSPRYRQWRNSRLEEAGFKATDVEIELACRSLHRDLPDGGGAD